MHPWVLGLHLKMENLSYSNRRSACGCWAACRNHPPLVNISPARCSATPQPRKKKEWIKTFPELFSSAASSVSLYRLEKQHRKCLVQGRPFRAYEKPPEKTVAQHEVLPATDVPCWLCFHSLDGALRLMFSPVQLSATDMLVLLVHQCCGCTSQEGKHWREALARELEAKMAVLKDQWDEDARRGRSTRSARRRSGRRRCSARGMSGRGGSVSSASG